MQTLTPEQALSVASQLAVILVETYLLSFTA